MPQEQFESSANDDPLQPGGTQPRERVVGYQFGDSLLDTDSGVIVIEDTAYCDGRGSPDYVECVRFSKSLHSTHPLTVIQQ